MEASTDDNYFPLLLQIGRRRLGYGAPKPALLAGLTGTGRRSPDSCPPTRCTRSFCASRSRTSTASAPSAGHGPPLIVAGYHTAYRSDGVICDFVDLSGNVFKRVRAMGDEWVTTIHLDFVCTSKGTSSSNRLLNLATGAVFALPGELAEEHAGDERDISHYISVAAFGHVASTGEYNAGFYLPVV